MRISNQDFRDEDSSDNTSGEDEDKDGDGSGNEAGNGARDIKSNAYRAKSYLDISKAYENR